MTHQNNRKNNELTLKEVLNMLTTAHCNFASRPVFFVFNHRRFMANSIAFSVRGEEYRLIFDGGIEPITSNDMIDMMIKMYRLYGDRPVKVMVDGAASWHIVDLDFQTSGRDYCLICEKAD